MTPAPARVDELKKRYEENPRRFFAPLANEYRKAGDLDAAIDLCRMHLEEQPGHLSGHIVYGQALYEAGRPADAKATFEAALELDPENLIALRHLGDIATADGDTSSARHWYQRVLDADPRNDEVIALIAALVDRPSSTVTIAEDAPPPPAPQYAEQEQQRVSAMADLPMIESSEPVAAPSHMADIPLMDFEPTSHEAEPAPTPEPITEPTPIAASAPPAPRGSIGLMDLDLDLGSETPATGDLLAGNLTPAAPSPVVEEAASVFEEGFPVADAPLNTSFDTTHELIGAADTNLGLPEPEVPVVEDASFGVDLDAPEPSTFGAVPSEPVFGEAHDAIAMESFELPAEPMVEPIAEATAPAAPTASDFDMLFGNAPLGDVTVGGDTAGTIDTADAGFVADSFIGREPTDEHIDTPAEVGATPPPFVTETMAELYLQQGFRDEALGVYRQLLAQNPGDHGLAERIRHLEQGTRSSMALDSVSEGIVHEAEEAERRRTGDIPVVSSAPEMEPVVEPVTEPTPVMAEMEPGAMMIDTTPAFLVQAPPKPAAPKGPLARDVFAMIANRRAVPSAVAGEVPVPVPVHQEQVASAPIVEPVTGGSLDRLFAAGGVNTDDESAAAAMSGAFGSTADAAPVQGAPTYKSDNELSLNSVFGEARPTAQVQRQSTKLRFDQFFAATDEAPSASPAAPLSPAPQGEEDIAQFNDWLKGLKGS